MRLLIRLSLLALFSALLIGCATHAAPAPGSTSGSSAVRAAEATHYRLVSDPKSIRTIDWANPPRDLHVKGVLTARGFEPIGEVEGRGRLCEEGNDWVSLRDGSFHAADSGDRPESPFIRGCKGRTGGFMPAGVNVS